jgi:xanthine dehydrogenase accessory factor
MQKQLQTWQLINNSLQHDIAVTLLYVLESKGSSPGRQGFMMAVNNNGEMEGSIGGGIMEHKFVEMAKEHLKKNIVRLDIRKQIHDKDAAKDQSGMICSGEQTIFIYHVQKEEWQHIKNIIASIEANKNRLLTLSPKGIYFATDANPYFNFHFHFVDDNDWQYQEKTGYKNHLYIIGGGHCSLAFSQLMSTMDFYIHLFDNREALHTMEQNEFAHEKIVVNDYSLLAELIPSGDENYVVIMTFGYRTDKVALNALIDKHFKYFGVLGSKNKMGKMFSDLKKEGVIDGLLKNIHAPVGLPIKSETPEEIAISIAAEIIKVKNEVAAKVKV